MLLLSSSSWAFPDEQGLDRSPTLDSRAKLISGTFAGQPRSGLLTLLTDLTEVLIELKHPSVRDLRVTTTPAKRGAASTVYPLTYTGRAPRLVESPSADDRRMALMRLIRLPGKIDSGKIVLDVFRCSTCPKSRCASRLADIALVSQADELTQSGGAGAPADRRCAARSYVKMHRKSAESGLAN